MKIKIHIMAISIEDALTLIYKKTKSVKTQILPLEEALGAVLAQEIIATHSLPPYDNSAMDGYAVKLCDAGGIVKVHQTIFAGDSKEFVCKEGFAFKIMTGAKLPAGCEAIVPIEDVTLHESGVMLPEVIKQDRHIRHMGEDVMQGDVILTLGTRVHAHQITLLASQGISHVKVYKKPKVAIFASGNELKMHFEKLEAHQLYNTNSPTILARARELGCEVEFLGTATDTLEDIKLHIKNALESDLIITTGGVSVGDADFTKEAFCAFGYEIFFDKVEIKPGKPTTVGQIGDCMILNLPGNPMAAALNFELFGQSIILALSAQSAKYISPIFTKTASDFSLKTSKRQLIAGIFNGKEFAPLLNSSPGMITPLSLANAYAIIDESSCMMKKGDEIKIISTRFSLTNDNTQELINHKS